MVSEGQEKNQVHEDKPKAEVAKPDPISKPLNKQNGIMDKIIAKGAFTIIAIIAFVLGGFVGVVFFGGEKDLHDHESGMSKQKEMYTCPMHPQIQSDKPGTCSICGMDLVLQKDGGRQGKRELMMSEAALQLAEIDTHPVEKKYVEAEVRLVGKLAFDETLVKQITARFPGRLDRLFVDYTGVPINKGEHLVEIYSPELYTAQQELLQASKAVNDLTSADHDSIRQMAKTTLEVTRDKLRLWDLTKNQIEEIEKKLTPSDRLTLYSPIDGIVINKHAVEGKYVKTGDNLYTIADMSRLWLKLDAYESDIKWLYYGQAVEFEVEAYPGEIFYGQISFIDPVLNSKTRTVKLRVNVENSKNMLKPEMFVKAIVKVKVCKNGVVKSTSLAGKMICPMHPEVIKDSAGDCDICGMKLIKADNMISSSTVLTEPGVVIPYTAPLITGERAVVYVKKRNENDQFISPPTFEGRDVILSGRAGDYYLVKSGLKEGETVVTNGNFNIDSALQIGQSYSMMNPAPVIIDAPWPVKVNQKYKAPEEFKLQLSKSIDNYLKLRDLLYNNKLEDLGKVLSQFEVDIKNIDMNLLKGSAHMLWMKHLKLIQSGIKEFKNADNLSLKRQNFALISAGIVSALESFGHAEKETIKRYECSMALGNSKGAVWLQRTDNTENPYFGIDNGMKGCSTGNRVLPFTPKTDKDPKIMKDMNEHKEHMKNKSTEETGVSIKFRKQLLFVVSKYLELQKALVKNDLKSSDTTSKAMSDALNNVDMKLLKDMTKHMEWMKHLKQINGGLEKIQLAANLAEKRKHFATISIGISKAIKLFGNSSNQNIYLFECSMALGSDGGASWLQDSDDVRNPYFGEGTGMFRCSTGKEIISPAVKFMEVEDER